MTEKIETRIDVEMQNLSSEGPRERLTSVLVDTSSPLSWVPAPMLEVLGIARRKRRLFRKPDGTTVQRHVGEVLLHVGDRRTADEAVFAEITDRVVVGARSLSGLNLRIDPGSRTLVDAGPAPVGVAPDNADS